MYQNGHLRWPGYCYVYDRKSLTRQLGVQAMVWSACGADVQLRVNTNMLVKTNRQMEEALAVVDSADFQTGIVFHLQFQRC